MVSAGGRKRRPQRRRRPRQGRRQKNHRRRPPAKQVKHDGKKQKPTERLKKGASKRSFDPINTRMLNQIKRDGKLLSREAKWLMVSFLQDVYRQVSSEADRLRKESRRPIISPVHVQAALRRVMPKRWRHVSSVASRNGR